MNVSSGVSGCWPRGFSVADAELWGGVHGGVSNFRRLSLLVPLVWVWDQRAGHAFRGIIAFIGLWGLRRSCSTANLIKKSCCESLEIFQGLGFVVSFDDSALLLLGCFPFFFGIIFEPFLGSLGCRSFLFLIVFSQW